MVQSVMRCCWDMVGSLQWRNEGGTIRLPG